MHARRTPGRLDRMAARLDRHCAGFPPSRRRHVRTIMLANGAILLIGGIGGALLFLALAIESHGLRAVVDLRLLVVLAPLGVLAGAGWLMNAIGRRLSV